MPSRFRARAIVGLLTGHVLGCLIIAGILRVVVSHHGTFFINTGNTNAGIDSAMTWAQLTSLNNAGNEIAGHTLDEYNLKGCTDQQTCTTEVCQDHQNLVNHGFYPVSFAYPFGAYDANAESIVKGCGYTSGRAAGGIDVAGDGAGPVYAEALPPKDVFATRTIYDPPSGNPPNVPPLQLSHMESAITAAAGTSTIAATSPAISFGSKSVIQTSRLRLSLSAKT